MNHISQPSSYTVLKIFLIIVIVSYFGTAFYLHKIGHVETYPFFVWMPFADAPEKIQIDFEGRIIKHNSEDLNPPLTFDEAYGTYLDPSIPLPHYNAMIRDLFRFTRNNQEDGLSQVRHSIEKGFLKNNVVYAIVKVEFDIIERWKTGEILSEEVIYTYEVN